MVTTYASGAFLATIPSPSQGVWQLGPIPLRAYALCIIAGIIVAIWWGERRFVARGGPAGAVTDIAVFAVPFGLVGGRIYHVMTDYDKYFGEGKNPVEALMIWKGGLGIWGAIALGAVGAWIACRRRGIPLPAMADALAPGIVLAQAIGRLGNYFNQELYGGPTTLPWGLEIYERVDPVTKLKNDLGGVAVDHTPIDIVHPTFLYELLWNVGVAVLIVWADRRFRLGHGRVFALYVAGYTAGRFWIELMRTDYATLVFGQRINVWVSILVFIGAVVAFVLTRNSGPREDLSLIPALDADKTTKTTKTGEPADEADGGTAKAKADVAEPGAGAEAEGEKSSIAVKTPDAKPDEDAKSAGDKPEKSE